MKAYLTVGEMGSLFGLNVQTLHYYDKIGLFCPQLRDQATGRRKYKFDQVYQLATIRYLRKMGYPLEDVRVYLNSRSPVHTMELLKERSAALRAQWQELMRIDEAILRKLQFMEKKQGQIHWDGVSRVTFPERRYIPIGSEEILYMKDSFYFYPTIAFYEENLKYFGAYVSGPDMGEDLPEVPEATESIPAGEYLVCFHRGSYDEIPAHIAKIRQENAKLRLSPLTVTFNIIDQFVENKVDRYVTELQIQILDS